MDPHDRSKYDVSGNIEAEYIDEAHSILVNQPGICDLQALQIAEEEGLARAYELLLSEVRTDTPMTCELLRHIHACIFGDLYVWAGRWRTVRISKPGAAWPPPQYLDVAMEQFERDILNRYRANELKDDESFCQALGEIQGEFLSIHPFREGNARTIKLMTNLLAVQSGRPLLIYDATAAEQYIEAAKAALVWKDNRLLIEIIRQALKRARE